MDFMQAALVRCLFWTIRMLPVRLAGGLGAGLGRMAYVIDERHRMIALRNLARVYPDRDDAWRRRTARESFAELGRTCFELPHVFLRSWEFLRSRVTIEGEETFKQALGRKGGVLLTGCHHSNWELGSLMLSAFGCQPDLMYRPIRQPGIDRFIKHCRERFGARLHSRFDSTRWLPAALKKGECVGIMVDQHLSSGTPIPFLGHPANTTTLPAIYAIKFHTALFGAVFERIDRRFSFRLRILPIELPELTGNRDTDINRITERISDSFAPAIHQRPELWLWPHRRWLILDEDTDSKEVAYGAV
jgi:KDO2-lipid IV(A) lauroyltransferase